MCRSRIQNGRNKPMGYGRVKYPRHPHFATLQRSHQTLAGGWSTEHEIAPGPAAQARTFVAGRSTGPR